MTDTLGRRLARYRKRAGFSSTRELSEHVEGRVSESVLQNIESGRRTDLAVSQLLEIAYALRISPVLLLAPMERPLEQVDLPDVGPELGSLSAAEFDRWFAGSADQPVAQLFSRRGSTTAVLQLFALEAVRRLVPDLEELRACDEELRQVEADTERSPLVDERREGLLLERQQLRERIDRNADALDRQGMPIDWIERPWREQGGR